MATARIHLTLSNTFSALPVGGTFTAITGGFTTVAGNIAIHSAKMSLKWCRVYNKYTKLEFSVGSDTGITDVIASTEGSLLARDNIGITFYSAKNILKATGQTVTFTVQTSNPNWGGNYFNISRVPEYWYIDIEYTVLQSGLTLNKTMVDAGDAIRANIVAGGSEYTHRLTWSFGSRTQVNSVGAGVAYNDFTPPLEWLDQIPNATSGLASVKLETLSGAAVAGDVTGYFTIGAPLSVKPTISALTASRVNGAVPAEWSMYVQGKSGVTLNGTASGAYGSTITSWLISGDGKSGNTGILAVNPISGSGEITFTASVTDSRGRTDSNTIMIPVVPYSAVSLNAMNDVRCDENEIPQTDGQYALCQPEYTMASVLGKNAATVTIEYREKGTSPWTPGYSGVLASGTNKRIGIAMLPTKAYEIKYTVSDQLTTTTGISVIATSECFIDRMPGRRRLGVGGYCDTDNTLYVAAQMGVKLGTPLGVASGGTGAGTATEARTALGITAAINSAINTAIAEARLAENPIGTIKLTTTSTNPSTYIGGTWIAWGAGRVPVGVNAGDADFNIVEKTGGSKTNSHQHTAYNSTLLAAIGAFNNDIASLGYYGIGKGPYDFNFGKTGVQASRYTANASINHSTPVHGTVDYSTISIVQPYVTCYMWKRTA